LDGNWSKLDAIHFTKATVSKHVWKLFKGALHKHDLYL